MWLLDRLCRLLAEEGLAACASESTTIVTPTGDSFTGLLPVERVCAVSIIRAGDSLLDAVMACDPSVAVGMSLRASRVSVDNDVTHTGWYQCVHAHEQGRF